MSDSGSNSRWLEDITIEFVNGRPSGKLKLVIVADVRKEYTIKKSKEKTICRSSNEKIPCQSIKEMKIDLFEVHHLSKDVRILSIVLPLDNNDHDEIFTSDVDNKTNIWLKFARVSLREEVEEIKRITSEQKVVLDKITVVRRFFESFEIICDTVKEIHPYIEGACKALLLIYTLFEKQEKCRDAARDLVEEMEEVLGIGFEKLSSFLVTNKKTRMAFISIAKVIRDIHLVIAEENKGMARTAIRDAFTTGYESELDSLRNRLRKAKEGLRDTVSFGTWVLVENAGLKKSLKFVPAAHYRSGEGCLENTRVALLREVDVWLRKAEEKKKTAWVNGYAGSGKSALMNSIAERLEDAGIPFTYFSCKRDDADRSDIHRILPTIAYDLTRHYGDYRGFISNLVDDPAGRSILTGNVKKQGELLLGKSPSYEVISPDPGGAHRPPVHVIIIDAINECGDIRERSALAKLLRNLANAVPWLKVIITSRREPDIVSTFGRASDDVDYIDINDKKWGTDADIRLFIQSKSRDLNLDLSDDQVDLFQMKASGLFLWCTTVFRFIEESKESRTRTIKNILGVRSTEQLNRNENPHFPLYLLYQHVLDTAVTKAHDRSLMELILSMIFVTASRQPLTTDAIADILFPDADPGEERGEKREWVANITECLFAILYVEGQSGVVRTCHPSVLDFIEEALSPEKEGCLVKPFAIGLGEIHARMFEGCFALMNRDLRFNICVLGDSLHLNADVHDLFDRINHHIPLALRYSTLFWVSHLQQSGTKGSLVGDRIIAFLKSPKALFWVEALSLLNATDRGVIILQDCATFFVGQTDILDIANEWERFLLACGDALQSTPHLYLSAISWLPQNSRLRKLIKKSFPFDLPGIANVAMAWDAERWAEYVGKSVLSVAYSPDGRFFAGGCEDGSIRLWEARSGKRIGEPLISESNANSIDISRDSRLLASAHNDGVVRLWRLSGDDAGPKLLEGHNDKVTSVTFSSDGKRIISSSHDKTIVLWDVLTGTMIRDPLKGHIRFIRSSTFSADNTRVFSASSSDHTIRTWSSETGEQIGEPLEARWVRAISCSPDGRFMAFNDDNVVMLSNAGTGKRIRKLKGHVDTVVSIRFSTDSRYLVSGSLDHSIRVWNVQTRSLVCELRGHTSQVSSVTFSKNGRHVLSGSLDGTVRIWSFEATVRAERPPEGHSAPVVCVAYTPDGDRIVSGSDHGKICFWEAHTGIPAGEPILGHTGSVNSIALTRDGRWLVSGSDDRSVRIWDATTGRAHGESMVGHTRRVNSVAVSPDNRYIVSGSSDDTVRLWDIATHSMMKVFEGHEDMVVSVAFSADGRSIISGSDDKTVRVWDINIGTQNQLEADILLDVAQAELTGGVVGMSSNGKWVASASWNDICSIWNTSSSYAEPFSTLTHLSEVASIAFSSDGNYLIAGSRNNGISLCNLKTGETVGCLLEGHTRPVNCVAFSPSGEEFVSGSDDGTIRVWDIRARTKFDSQTLDSSNGSQDLVAVGHREAHHREMDKSDGWIRDGKKLLLWVPLQYRHDLNGGTKLVIGAHVKDVRRPEVDYSTLLRYSGRLWVDIYKETL